MEDFSHRDVITIELRGEQAKEVLLELQNTLTAIEAKLTMLGTSMDTAFVHIAGPLKAIEVSAAQTVRELEMLRGQVAGLGPAGTAGPETVSAQFQRMRGEVGLTSTDVNRLRYELSQIGTIPMLPAAGRLAQAQAGLGAFAPAPEAEPGATMYVTPSGVAYTAKEVEDLAEAHRRATRAAQDYATTQGDVAKETDRSTGSFQRHIRWFLEGTILYMTITRAIRAVGDAFSDTISILSDYDLAMAQASYVTGQTEDAMGTLLNQVAALGAQYALLPSESIPGAVDITRAFKDQTDQMIIAENAARLSLMTGISYAQAIDQLVAILRQYNMEASDSNRILDLAAIAYQNTMVPMDDFLRGLAKGAPLADMMGMKIEELAGFMSALSEITILEPEQQVTLLRRVTAAMYRPETASELLKEYGISAFRAGAPAAQRPPTDILKDIMGIWEDLTDEQQTYLANLLAGSQAIGGMGPTLKVVFDAQARINEATADFTTEIEKGGQAEEYIDQLLGTLPVKMQTMTAETKLFLLALGESSGALDGIKTLIGEITDGLRGWRSALEASKETGISLPVGYVGGMLGLSPEQIQELQRQYERVQPFMQTAMQAAFPWMRATAQPGAEQIAGPQGITRPSRTELGLTEVAFAGQMIPTDEVLTTQQQILLTTDEWIRSLEVGRGIIDVSALSQEQINQALATSIQMVQALTDGYIAQAEAMQGGQITAEQREEIEKRVKEWYEDQTVILKDQEGIFRVITGAQAAMFQQAMKSMEALDKMGVQRLRDFTPAMLNQVVQMARIWEQRLTGMGFQEEAQRALLIGEEPDFWVTFEGGMTALRFAIQDLQDAMEEQTGVLRGHFNIPGGYVVPTPWDYYSAMGTQAPVAVGPMNYPPEVLQRYYGYQFGGGGTTGGGGGLLGNLGAVPAMWAGTIPRATGWDVGDWSDLLAKAAEMYGLDPRLLASIMQVESGGVPTAVGAQTKWGRAQGLMQVMPFHAGRLEPGETLQDPWANIRIGAEILSEAIGRYGVPTGVAAYYGGVSQGAVTPAGENYLRLVESAFTNLFGGRAEGQELMTVQGVPEIERVLSSTKATQDSYGAASVQQLVQVNQNLSYILAAVRQQMQPQVTVVMADTAQAVQQGRRSAQGKGGAVIGHKPEAYY